MVEENRNESLKVQEILDKAETESALKYKSTDVSKEVDPETDVGNLLLIDQQPLFSFDVRSNQKSLLNQLARDNTQLLFNQIWKLPLERFNDMVMAKLPSPTTIIPRGKKIPKPKPPTKWEIYANKKGIQKKKRDRMIWDEEAKEWKPRYGYKRVGDVNDKWLIELPDQADPNVDQFEKLQKEKKEHVAKNELQRLRNIAKNKKFGNNIISTELKPETRKGKERITKELNVARVSTASLGRFQDKLPNEKDKERKGVKRKFNAVSGDSAVEKENYLNIFNRIHNPSILQKDTVTSKAAVKGESRSSGKRNSGSRVKNRVFKGKKGLNAKTAKRNKTGGKAALSKKNKTKR